MSYFAQKKFTDFTLCLLIQSLEVLNVNYWFIYQKDIYYKHEIFNDLNYLLRCVHHGHKVTCAWHNWQCWLITSFFYSIDVKNLYPSSSHYTRNWDKLVGEIKEEEKNEKLEGDAALNKLFQQIYSDGSDEVKRAMNKSFVRT